MKAKYLAAAIQMTSGIDAQANLKRARSLVQEASKRGAELVVLPEYFSLMAQSDTDKLGLAETEGSGPVQQALSAMARENRVMLLGGTVPLVSPHPGKSFNASLLYNPQGECLARYDKIHLFDFTGQGERYCESNTVHPGVEPVKVTTALGELGLAVCYDLRFPELLRRLAPFDVLLLPAAFTATTGMAHWEVLLRARAIENQCYVIASAQCGQHENGRHTHGHSMIINPWGQIVAELPKGEGVIMAEIDAQMLQSVRSSLPALTHRVL